MRWERATPGALIGATFWLVRQSPHPEQVGALPENGAARASPPGYFIDASVSASGAMLVRIRP